MATNKKTKAATAAAADKAEHVLCCSCRYRIDRTNRPQCRCKCDHGVNSTNGYMREDMARYGFGAVMCTSCCNHRTCAECGGCSTNTYLEKGKCECPQCPRCRLPRSVRKVCTCCPETDPSTHWCLDCCRHRCCRGPVEQVNRDLVFWAPTLVAKKRAETEGANGGYLPLSHSASELVLAGTYTPKDCGDRLDLRGFSLNRSRRFAATEIEVCGVLNNGVPVNKVCDRWSCSVVHDGSVHPWGEWARAFEINSSPACGDAMYDQISDLTAALVATQCRVDESCGLHVHVDARDFGYQEIRRLVAIYSEVEHALFAAVHPNRFNNRYTGKCGQAYKRNIVDGTDPNMWDGKLQCEYCGGWNPNVNTLPEGDTRGHIHGCSLGTTKGIKKAIVEQTYERGSMEARRALDRPDRAPAPRNTRRTVLPPTYHEWRQPDRHRWRGPARYFALNLHSWFLRGTVESRLHHGSIAFNDIYQWMRMFVSLMDKVAKLSEAKVKTACEVTDDQRAELRREIGMPPPGKLNPDYRRRDVSSTEVSKGMVVLQRVLPERDFQFLVDRVQYFGKYPEVEVANVVASKLYE